MTWITDGALKSWEADSGHNITILPSTHKGWITQLVFWSVNSTVIYLVANYCIIDVIICKIAYYYIIAYNI